MCSLIITYKNLHSQHICFPQHQLLYLGKKMVVTQLFCSLPQLALGHCFWHQHNMCTLMCSMLRFQLWRLLLRWQIIIYWIKVLNYWLLTWAWKQLSQVVPFYPNDKAIPQETILTLCSDYKSLSHFGLENREVIRIDKYWCIWLNNQQEMPENTAA